ncbi:MAG: hypothetical protein J4432_03000 [DPANN group archaeon]|nr:hypothetical protein [DPANN group archaeon]
MKGQLSIEYLLVLSVALSVVLLMSPILVKIKSSHSAVLEKQELARLYDKINAACDRSTYYGIKQSVSIALEHVKLPDFVKTRLPCNLERHNDTISVMRK